MELRQMLSSAPIISSPATCLAPPIAAQFDPFHYFFHSVSLVSFPPKQKNDEGIGVGRGAF